jgi:hypothetical protein
MGISKQELFSMLEVSMDRERMGISKQELCFEMPILSLSILSTTYIMASVLL